jgi:hypothetical protein
MTAVNNRQFGSRRRNDVNAPFRGEGGSPSDRSVSTVLLMDGIRAWMA